jgi:hypothetical protein
MAANGREEGVRGWSNEALAAYVRSEPEAIRLLIVEIGEEAVRDLLWPPRLTEAQQNALLDCISVSTTEEWLSHLQDRAVAGT